MAAAPAGPLLLQVSPDTVRVLVATRGYLELLLGVETTLADAGLQLEHGLLVGRYVLCEHNGSCRLALVLAAVGRVDEAVLIVQLEDGGTVAEKHVSVRHVSIDNPLADAHGAAEVDLPASLQQPLPQAISAAWRGLFAMLQSQERFSPRKMAAALQLGCQTASIPADDPGAWLATAEQLALAVISGCPPAVEAAAAACGSLLPRLAVTNVPAAGRLTPLVLAARNSDPAVLGTLLAAGAAMDAQDDDGYAALHLAAATGQLEVAKRLVAAGARVDDASAGGETPLHIAARRGQEEMAQWLVEAGASQTAVSSCLSESG